MDRHCICCEKPLEHCGPEGEDSLSNPPNDATYWQTSGNFGSTVFDSMGEEILETYICDECLKKKAKYVYRFRIDTRREIKDVRIFDPKL